MKALARIAFLVALILGSHLTVARADEAANEALAKRFYTEFNARNFTAFAEFIAAGFVDHNPLPGQPAGLDGLTQAMKGFATASSDIQITNELVIAKGDYVTVYSTCKGTQTGPLMKVPPSNKPFTFHTIDIWLVKDGKLAEAWHVEELLSLLGQIGALGEK